MLTGADGGLTSILWNLTDPGRPRRSATVTGAAVFAGVHDAVDGLFREQPRVADARSLSARRRAEPRAST